MVRFWPNPSLCRHRTIALPLLNCPPIFRWYNLFVGVIRRVLKASKQVHHRFPRGASLKTITMSTTEPVMAGDDSYSEDKTHPTTEF
jgi:hypothetical protein